MIAVERAEEVVAALREAKEDMAGWASYAGDYFREKWDIEADLAKLDTAIPIAEALVEVVRAADRYEEALRETRAVAEGRLQEAIGMADNDYAAYDHISGISRRALNHLEDLP